MIYLLIVTFLLLVGIVLQRRELFQQRDTIQTLEAEINFTKSMLDSTSNLAYDNGFEDGLDQYETDLLQAMKDQGYRV